ncbi:hypothetical protein A2125_02565 [Candidatus Woesebacteria bacterium GWB1_43_5]|uniref:Dolichyl-phosphate-mannose--protein mannosyltransferase n=1 Tax=Candidatus Woesebacteria bacterium GWB1_43_5 TaxID=1802474 RepID=A0A1F7WSU4_9BACT|nr:MAG: hypothetical protein A2125_02565 [Candidatus Woesebacteria bacterium GWB1_43_5]
MLVRNKIQKLVFFCLFAFAVRLIFSQLPSFEIDMNAWLAWAWRMKGFGPAGFYSDQVWTQYTPGFLYWLWGLASLGWANELMIKTTVILADIMTGLVIWKIVSAKSEKLANLSFFLYVLNPVIIFTGSVWGQIDGILTLFLVASSYFLIEKKNAAIGAFFWALAFLIKPQAIVFLPAAFLAIFGSKLNVRNYIYFVLVSFVTLLVFSLPFFPNNPIFGLPQLVGKMTGYYNYTSVFAFNIWTVLVGMWKQDNATFLGLSYQFWGVALYLLSLAFIFFRFRKDITRKEIQYLVIALSLFAAFLFPTRVHERYLFPMFAFLLISAGLFSSRLLLGSFIGLSIFNFLNLYHPYAYYSENFLRSEGLLRLTGNLSKPITVLSTLFFFGVIKLLKYEKNIVVSMYRYIDTRDKHGKNGIEERFPKINFGQKNLKFILISILAFSFATRIFALSSPTNEYFDEVYHAFTARRMLHGDIRAWEWWNTPPEGFAYEWTHPPLAKFGMVLGMAVFGENAFGWRFPGAILGVVSIYLVYLIAKSLFKDELIGILAAGVFSLDGLSLVMSRIAMNDIYFLAFALASLYFYLKGRNFVSAVFFGLSLASKWSAVWLVPIIFVAHFVLSKKLNRSYLFFVLVPPLIYLASYLPFFVQGHTFKQFFNINAITKCFGQTPCDQSFGLQQQMWWYHTNLVATHSYTSPWWSWPLNARPVYLYTSEIVNGMVSRIYLIGNPFVFWLGLLGVLAVFYRALKDRPRKNILLFVIFAYLIFFVPWALSPRIMFLYHYLPSIPFMCISLAYLLRRYPKAITYLLVPSALVFLYFYPHWTGLWVPEWLDTSYYWFSSWR